MLGRSVAKVSQVLRCTVFTELAEKLAAQLITLINFLYGFNRVDTVFVQSLTLEETKDISNPFLRFVDQAF